MFLCYQSDSIIQHCIFILHEICYGLGYLMMGRYAYTFHGETFRRDVRLAGRDTEIGPLFGTERTGAIAGIPSGSFADEGDISAFLHVECEALGSYNPQIQISAESETKRSIFREKDKTKRSKKESAQHSKSRNKSFVMTSVSAL